MGDRVKGTWNGVPFIGSVGNDSLVSEAQGPRVSVFLDLPLQHQGMVHKIIMVTPDQLMPFK